MNTGNSKYVKKLNRMAIINLIKENEPISRQEIAEATGLTPPAITGIIRELIELGFVEEVGLGKSQGGRRPVKLKLNCSVGYVLGVEVTSKEVTFAVADLKNMPSDIQTIQLDMTDSETSSQELIRAIKNYMDRHKKKNFLGIGIAFPAILQEGVVKRSVNLGPKWCNFPLKSILEKKLHVPVLIDTNSKVAAMGENWFGDGKLSSNLIYINIGEGVSAGILMNGSIIQGTHGNAGQIGHTIILEQGPLCKCGNRGCLEAVCAGPALAKKVMEELPFIDPSSILKKRFDENKTIEVKDIIYAALQEDPYAQALFHQVGKYLGMVVSDVINFYNPDEVFIGGKLAIAAEVFIEDIKEVVSTHAFPEAANSTVIRISKLGANSGAIGACALTLNHLLKSNQFDMLEDNQG
ncbi:MAG: Glucokinase [Firmicutes bacterium]|nr:Glucokinase [Bacillota bacterium]